MKNWFTIARFAMLSLVCVAVAYLFFGAFVVTGTNRLLGSTMQHVAQFVILCPCLIGVILALASVIWNPRKAPGVIALVVAVAGTWALYWMGAEGADRASRDAHPDPANARDQNGAPGFRRWHLGVLAAGRRFFTCLRNTGKLRCANPFHRHS